MARIFGRNLVLTVSISCFLFLGLNFELKGQGDTKANNQKGEKSKKSAPKEGKKDNLEAGSAQKKPVNDTPQNLIGKNGFGSAAWGESFIVVKKKLVGKLNQIEEGEFIISDYGELKLKYGFFRDPESKPDNAAAGLGGKTQADDEKNQLKLMTEKEQKEKKINDDAKLFYVTIRLPYLITSKIEKKLTSRLGKSAGKKIEKNQGLIWWDAGENLVLIWVDAVENESYTRKIDVIGKKIRSQVMARQRDIYSAKEKKLLENLNF